MIHANVLTQSATTTPLPGPALLAGLVTHAYRFKTGQRAISEMGIVSTAAATDDVLFVWAPDSPISGLLNQRDRMPTCG